VNPLVRRYIKTAVVFFLIGRAIGAHILVVREWRRVPPSAYEVSAHTHAILVGFVMMMILGVALWMFPRPERDDRWYHPGIAEAAYWMLVAGTAVRIAGELLEAGGNAGVVVRAGVIGGGLLQVAGVTAFFATMWTRIRASGSRAREEKGERF
jgi:heme/copper-type cytochrome/quinol oxidase subunit 1